MAALIYKDLRLVLTGFSPLVVLAALGALLQAFAGRPAMEDHTLASINILLIIAPAIIAAVAGECFARERQDGTLLSLGATPVARWGLWCAKLISAAVGGMLVVGAMLAMATVILLLGGLAAHEAVTLRVFVRDYAFIALAVAPAMAAGCHLTSCLSKRAFPATLSGIALAAAALIMAGTNGPPILLRLFGLPRNDFMVGMHAVVLGGLVTLCLLAASLYGFAVTPIAEHRLRARRTVVALIVLLAPLVALTALQLLMDL